MDSDEEEAGTFECKGTTKAWHSYRSQDIYVYLAMKDNEVHCGWRQPHRAGRPVMIILVLTRLRNRNTCGGVGGEVIQATASDTSINLIKWMKFSWKVPDFQLRPQQSKLWSGLKIPTQLVGFEPMTFYLHSEALTTTPACWVCCLHSWNLSRLATRWLEREPKLIEI